MRTYLNDPTHVRGAAVSQPQLKTIGPGERYVACVRYNARKIDGKYAGSKDGVAIYVSGKLDRFFDTPKEVSENCARTRPTRRFPSWRRSRASARSRKHVLDLIGDANGFRKISCARIRIAAPIRRAPTAALDELGGSRFRQKGRK